tara:strand:- start:29985 stop:34355 length:4371 start_codon:yes stop_codon:yes gene_type:complete
MADDPNVNLYDVVKEAELYFEQIDKSAKGSGWKSYQRWLYENEPKYFPTGNRKFIDPLLVENEFIRLTKSNKNLDKSSFNNGWNELGPSYIEEVTGHYSVGLGRIETFYIDLDDENRIFLGSRSGGFWKTNDGGQTWDNTTDFLIASGVNTIAVSPSDPDRILINVRNSKNGVTQGIYQSLNGGESWTQTNFIPENLNWGGLGTYDKIYKIMYHPSIPNLVFAGTSEGIYRSEDNFESFTRISVGNFSELTYNFDFIEFHPTNQNIIYASTMNNDSRIYISMNAGQNFSYSGNISGNNSAIKLSVSQACENCIYVGTSDGIWKSDNMGQTFSLVGNPGLPNYGAFAVSDTNPNYMLFGDIDTHMSTDGGQTWNKTTYWSIGNSTYDTTGQYVHADIRGAKSYNGTFWVNTDGLLAKSSDNGITWEFFEGQSIRENYCLGVSQSNTYRTVTGSQDNGTSIKTENGWIEFYGADGMEGIIHPLNDDWMIGSIQYGSKRRTKDGGYTQDGVNPTDFSGDWVTPLMYDPNNQMSIYTMSNNIYRSDDFGSTWLSLGWSGFSNNITAAAIAENNSEIIAIASYGEINLSIDGGFSFSDISQGLPGQWITDIAFDPNNDDTIIVTYDTYWGSNNKVYVSQNLGQTWQNITHNLGSMPIRSVVIDHTENSTIYLGAEIGVFKKGMNENSWELFNQNLPNTTVMELEVVYGSNSLRATTWGRGVWEHSLAHRENYPSILTTRISNQPTDTQPKEFVDQFVTSTIEYEGNLNSVYLEWLTESNSGTIQMSNSENNIWISDSPIPNFEQGTKIYFQVFAESSDGLTSETYDFMYEVKERVLCTPSMDCSYGDGLQLFQLEDIVNNSGCEGYGDFTNLSTELEQGSEYVLTLTTGYGDQYVSVWIDYNNDLEFTNDEVVLSNFIIEPGLNSPGSFTESVNISIPQDATIGQHILRVKTNYQGVVDSCQVTAYGETEDYTVDIVVNTTAPIITLIDNDIITIEVGSVFTDPGATATDSSGDQVDVTVTGTVDVNTVGTYTLTYTATDSSGNSSSITRVVGVVDTTDPALLVLGDIVTTIEYCISIFTDPGATATDNSGEDIAVTVEGTVDVYTIGTYTLTYSASDSSGNTATAIRIVNVLDTTPPELVLIGDPESTIEVGTPYSGSDVSCSGCGTHEITFQGWIQVGDPSEVSWNSVGTYTITYYCTDESGNSSSVSKIINVVDTVAPEIICDGIDIYLGENGEAIITIDDLVASVTDISGVAEVSTASELTFDCSMIGSNNVVITATDNYGNSSQCIPSVTVIDDMDPAAVCTINIVTLTLENGLAVITEDDIDPGSDTSDNCGIAFVELSKVEFTEEDLGSNTITMTVTDVNDNVSSCEVEVVVEAGLSVTENIMNDLLLYPNPTKGVIYLSKNIEINYGIYNSIGQKVIEGVTSDEINISQLANGMYYIKLEVENQTTNRKIIKN